MDDRADRIVASAIALAETGGFQAVRLRDVAANAGVAIGTLYSRFKSKEDILVAALERELDGFERVIAGYAVGGTTAVARVTTFFELATRTLVSRPDFCRAVMRSVSSGEPDVAEKVLRFQHRVSALLAATARGETFGGDSDATELDLRVAFLLQQIWFANLIGWMGGARDEASVVTEMGRAADVLLAGATVIGAATRDD